MHGPAGGVEFAAYITLYANCGITYVDDIDVADRPIRMFHGTASVARGEGHCRRHAETQVNIDI